MKMKAWNKMFIIEIGPGIPYPKQEERWQKYGEPLSQLFAPYFFGDKLFQWFKDDSENFLAGINVACFKSSSKWKDAQNEQKEFELFVYLSAPVNDFFTKLGSLASITGLCDVTESMFPGQLPAEFDEPDLERQGHLIKHNERHYFIYIGKHTGYKRFREISEEEAMEIAEADANPVWKTINETAELS